MASNLFWRRSTLPNGMRVLLYPRESANTAQLSLAVEFGSNQEPGQHAGVAHFIEHMLAGGSKRRIELSRGVENSGGILDFYTDHEYVMSTMDVLPGKLEGSAEILAELFFGENFEKEKFASEKRIILNELAEAADDPSEQLEEMLLDSLFSNHPVKRPVGGYSQTVRRLTLGRLKETYEAAYVPANMILVLSGNYIQKDAETVVGMFAQKTGKPAALKTPMIGKKVEPKSVVVKEKAGLSQSYISVGAQTVNSTHRDAAALNLISILLGGGTSSRLFVEMRENNALTYDVNATHCKGLDFGYLSVNCAVNTKKVGRAREIISKAFSELRTERVPAEELERCKNMVLGGVLRAVDSLEEAPDILTYMEIQFKNDRALLNYVSDIKTVTCEDIMRVANIYLQEYHFAAAILNPKKP